VTLALPPRNRSEVLERLDSQLSESIANIELKLRALVSIRISTKIEHSTFKALVFGKHDGRWGLLLEGIKDNAGMTPILSANRADRLQAIEDGWIDALIESIASTLDAEIKRRRAAIDKLDETLRRLDAKTTQEE
jgi:hypothetical protein